MVLAAAIEFGWWDTGMIRFMVEGQNLPRGPLGVLCYLVFAPPYWVLPARYRAGYLAVTALLLALATVGPAYAGLIVGLCLISLGVVNYCGTARRLSAGRSVLAGVYLALVVFPQPAWLPPVREPLYFYLHWAGIGYLFLRCYHVLADVAAGRMARPAALDFVAYLIFGPTLRMGPLFRFREFAAQMCAGPSAQRSALHAGIRLVTGMVRLGVMNALLERYPSSVLYGSPAELDNPQLLVHLYAAAMAIYLWISAYVDLSIAVGRVVGFAIPDNFNYPWRSLSVDEFWRRWHITLGAWLKDYVFVPLVKARFHYMFAFTLTFLLCGLWHGLYPSYLLWGASQGLAMGVRRWWSQTWKHLADRNSRSYATCRKLRLVDSPLNTALAWVVTFHYQILTISLFLDEQHTWRYLGPRLLAVFG